MVMTKLSGSTPEGPATGVKSAVGGVGRMAVAVESVPEGGCRGAAAEGPAGGLWAPEGPAIGLRGAVAEGPAGGLWAAEGGAVGLRPLRGAATEGPAGGLGGAGRGGEGGLGTDGTLGPALM